ncbi:MAG: bifunctional phosphopantothenoylcysteine decarboxylase/phosphopantothenate--cysteine ligase CoaBC, partial [Candidatus Dormibacteraceae bacterium]
AMSDAMWDKAAVEENLTRLRSRGMVVVEPESGRLASGHSGPGRLAPAARLMAALAEAARARYDLAGRRVVVTAGGTREPIDPVRFIGNRSSGKMGFAIAAAAAERGAAMTLVSAAQHPPHPGIQVVEVETAEQMLEALRRDLPGAAVLVMAAAVADYRPAWVQGEKMRREGVAELSLDLVRGVDILAELADLPGTAGVFRIGFAAEDSNLEERAREKLDRKRLDAVVANDISHRDRGFGSEVNAGLLLLRGGDTFELPLASKRQMADRIWDLVRDRLG